MSLVLKSEKFSHFENLLANESTAFSRNYFDDLLVKRTQLPHLDDILALNATLRSLDTSRADLSVGDSEYAAWAAEYQHAVDAQQALGHAALDAFGQLQGDIGDFIRYGSINLEYRDSDTKTLVDDLFSDISPDSLQSQAPFAMYKDNTDTKWQYVDDASVRRHLSDRSFFVPPSTAAQRFGVTLSILSRQYGATPIPVPENTVVYAAGFKSWLGRGEHGEDNKIPSTPISRYMEPGEQFTSLNTIKNYAATPTELPGVNVMNAYLQPDGTVVVDNDSGDSHRISAAFLRGHSHIMARKLSLHLLKSNYIDSSRLG